MNNGISYKEAMNNKKLNEFLDEEEDSE